MDLPPRESCWRVGAVRRTPSGRDQG